MDNVVITPHFHVVEGQLAGHSGIPWVVTSVVPHLLTAFNSLSSMYRILRERGYLDGEYMMTIRFGPTGLIHLTNENVEEQLALAMLSV